MSTTNTSSGANISGPQSEVFCPYVDCKGKFAPGRSDCPVCRRAIALCPNGHVMAAEIGFCDICGGNAKADHIESTISRKFVLGPDVLLELIADAYREAALVGMNMRSATELLEALRTALAGESDYHKAWDKLDEYIARTLDQRLRQVVFRTRERFMQEVIEGEVSRLAALFMSDQKHNWGEWLQTYAEALVNWRLHLAKALCEAPIAFSANDLPVLENIRRSTKLVLEERWPETFTLYRYLSDQHAIPPLHRARVMVTGGEIALYQLKLPDIAKKLFDAAQQLAPEESRVIYGQGEYCLQERRVDQALELAQKVIDNSPKSSQGYVLLGDCHEQQNQFERAEEAYQNAIRIAPGETGPYSRLLRLYGRPEQLPTYENRLLPLRELAAAIEPLNRYSLILDLGTAYQQSARYDEAHSWYDQAIQLDDRRLGAYVNKGYAYLEQEKSDQARAMFAKVIEVAPEASDGYWGMYYLHDQAEAWPEATVEYEKSLMRLTELTGVMRGFLEDRKPAPATFDEFKDQLFEDLRAEPANQIILSTFTTLADLYNKSGRMADALQLYERIREVKGSDYEADYRNLVGNVKYFWKDYQGAAEAYQAAIKANATEPLYHANLSLAYQGLKQWDEARLELEAGKSDQAEIAAVWNAEGNDYFAQNKFEEAIKRYEQAIAADEKRAVFHSNLALAWEKFNPDDGRLTALASAISALEHASELDPQDASYASRLKSLQGELKLAETYGGQIIGKTPLVTLLAIEVASDMVPFVAGPDGELLEELKTSTEDLRNRISRSFGVNISGIRFRGNEADLPSGTYIILLREVPIVMGTVAMQKRLFLGSAGDLAGLGIKAEAVTDPLTGNEAYWIDQEQAAALEAAGLTTRELMAYPMRHLEAVIRRNLNEFIDHQEVTNLLTMQPAAADMTAATEKLTAFTILLRALVSEEAPIVPLDEIQEKFAESLAQGKDLMAIVESVRSLPNIRPALHGNSADYSFYRLGKRLTTELAQSVRTEDGHQFLAMLPEKCQEALAAVRDKISAQRNVALVVEQAELRPLIRRLTELEFPNAPVLAFPELLPELAGRIIGEIELA